MEGHLFSNSVMDEGPRPPFISLIVSGGHTMLVLVKTWGDYQIVGQTRDDAVGEAFDKVAKMMYLSYPGGPAIDRLARQGNQEYVSFPRAKFKDGSLDFSYSGLKTAVLYHLQKLSPEERELHKADIAASFQTAAVEILVENSMKALEQFQINQLALAGGVACNSLLRKRMQEECRKRKYRLFFPPPDLCTDNAAMIARAGLFYLERGTRSDFSLSPKPSLSLQKN